MATVSPLKGFEGLPPLPPESEKSPDGKSLLNPPRHDGKPLSVAYERFPEPIQMSNNAFDVHVYFDAKDDEQVKYARALHERIRREFPELRIYKIWYEPIGPHEYPMFEINVFTPHQLGTLIGFLVAHRGPLPSVLVHPNTGDELRDHTELSTWLGAKLGLRVEFLKHPPPRGSPAQTPA